MGRGLGPVLVVVGVGIVVLGLLVWSGALSWFGRLPGDIRMEGERTRVHVPIVSMLLLSLVLTVVINVVLRWWR
jgi:di/tricarboxylate transporter